MNQDVYGNIIYGGGKQRYQFSASGCVHASVEYYAAIKEYSVN